VCSAIGEPLLLSKLIRHKRDLPEYGHAGEWLDNFLTSLVLTVFFVNGVIAANDLEETAIRIRVHLNQMDPTQKRGLKAEVLETIAAKHNRLVDVGNSEIQQVASGRFCARSLVFNPFHHKRGASLQKSFTN
jgi:hypothetical protein